MDELFYQYGDERIPLTIVRIPDSEERAMEEANAEARARAAHEMRGLAAECLLLIAAGIVAGGIAVTFIYTLWTSLTCSP